MNEREARASGRRVLVGKRPMTRVGRARERGETHGFMKILVDGDSREILGAAILGVEGDEVVHVIAAAMYARAPYTTDRARRLHAPDGERALADHAPGSRAALARGESLRGAGLSRRASPAVVAAISERETGLEPATSTLARLHSTTELLPQT